MRLGDPGPRQRRLVQLCARSYGIGARALLNRSASPVPTEESIEPARLVALEQAIDAYQQLPNGEKRRAALSALARAILDGGTASQDTMTWSMVERIVIARMQVWPDFTWRRRRGLEGVKPGEGSTRGGLPT